MSKKTKAELQEEITRLQYDNAFLEERILSLTAFPQESEVVFTKKAPTIPTTKKTVKYDRWWNFSIELWPPAWGLNYYRYNWQKGCSPNGTREGNFQIGPFGFSWNREQKR